MPDAPRISVSEVKQRMQAGEELTFIDVRNPQAWAESGMMVPGAIRMLPDERDRKLAEIPKNKPIVAYCT